MYKNMIFVFDEIYAIFSEIMQNSTYKPFNIWIKSVFHFETSKKWYTFNGRFYFAKNDATNAEQEVSCLLKLPNDQMYFNI